MRCSTNRSRTTIFSARRKLLWSKPRSSFAVRESGLSQPAAVASSGFRSITQKIIRPPLIRVNHAPNHEMSGGEVSATTASCRGSTARCNAQASEKLAKFSARLNRDFLFA